MTYSIVAYDEELKQLGVAVQSHSLCVGAVVPWAEAGVGAVVTQARSDRSKGSLGLGMMRAGKSAFQALNTVERPIKTPVLASQLLPEFRQGRIIVRFYQLRC